MDGLNQNHRLSWWYDHAFKAILPAARHGPWKNSPIATFPQAAAKAASLFYLSKNLLPHNQLSFLLFAYFCACSFRLPVNGSIYALNVNCSTVWSSAKSFWIYFYCASIRSRRIDVVTSTLEMPIPIFVLQVCMTIKDHQGTFPFQISHKLRHTQVRWNTYQHMNGIRASLGLQYFYFFQIAKLTQNFSYVFFDLFVDCLTCAEAI